jgi:serine/threonine-protein kinase
MSDSNRGSPPDQPTLWTDEEWLRAVARAPAIEACDVSYEEQARLRCGSVLKSRYRLDRILGIGGMATVYGAVHRNGDEVAIKILHSSLSTHRDLRARFLREGYVANAVGHPGVVRVLDDDVADDGCAFLVMDLLHGESLQARFQRLQRFDVHEVLKIAKELLDVLVAAHDKGIVHRDLKPDNLFMTQDGRLMVLDFGIARARVGPLALTTDTGRVLGTPLFMAPEQARGETAVIDAQTDIWACGATMFTLLSGHYVHETPRFDQITRLAATTAARSLASVMPNLPPSVTEVVDRALKFSKAERWDSAADMRAVVMKATATLQGAAPVLDRDVITVTAALRAPQAVTAGSSQPVPDDHQNFPSSSSPTPVRISAGTPGPIGDKVVRKGSVPESLGPLLSHAVDVDRYMKACPVEESTQGAFLQYIRDAVVDRTGSAPARLFDGLPRDRWLPFLKYPLRELMRLVVNAAGILHPKLPLSEGLRRVGWFGYPSFASTMAGRVVLFAFGETLEDVVRSVPKVYAICVPKAQVSLTLHEEHHFRLAFRGVHCFVDTYHRGVIEGAIWCHGFQPSVKVTVGTRLCDADMVADW